MSETPHLTSNFDENDQLASQLGIGIPDIYLPSDSEIFAGWPVIACDQFTSSPQFWSKVEERVRLVGVPSALNIILPEIYLEDPGEIPLEERISKINTTMSSYLSEGVLTSIGRCMVLTDRSTVNAPSRKGLIFVIDLESYEFTADTHARIRSTEGTVLSRIPPRLQIRKDAVLEIPHILLLVNDPDKSIIEPLAVKCADGGFEKLYDIDLPEQGGHIKGFRILGDSRDLTSALTAMHNLRSYIDTGLLFAVGDGNHSLATAKAHWENIRSASAPDHPARFALVELINIYDEGLHFEPIHRVLFDVIPEEFIISACEILPDAGIEVSEGMSFGNAVLMSSTIDKSVQPFTVFSSEKAFVLTLRNPPSFFTAGTVQYLLDKYIELNPDIRVDYIHGMEDIVSLSDRGTGIILPSLSKSEFFGIIAEHGALPRKTFSLGEALEKRYYMECRLIV